MIIVLGHVHIDPADMLQFREDIAALDPSRRPASGCLLYRVVQDDAASGRLLVIERWRDQPALTAHLHSQATGDFIRKWSGRMRGDVLKYDTENGRGLMD
jgi:quinol monooxygenase YgiN